MMRERKSLGYPSLAVIVPWALLALVLGFLLFDYACCSTRLTFSIDSDPRGAGVWVDGRRASASTPAELSYRYEGLADSPSITLRRAEATSTARLFIIDGGFKLSFEAYVEQAASADTAAWFVRPWNEIQVVFPVPGKFLVEYQLELRESLLRDGRVANRKDESVAGSAVYETIGVLKVPAGGTQLETSRWSLKLRLPDACRVSIRDGIVPSLSTTGDWRPNSGQLRLDRDITRFPTGTLVLDDGSPIDLGRLAGEPVFAGNRFEVDLQDDGGRQYRIEGDLLDHNALTLSVHV